MRTIAELENMSTEQPFQFLFKLFVFAILSNSSYFLCEQIINLNKIENPDKIQPGEKLYIMKG